MTFLSRLRCYCRPGSGRSAQSQQTISRARLCLEPLEERILLNNRFVVPNNITADNVTTFHSLNTALTTPGLASGNIVQIEPGSSPGNIASLPSINNLTIQGDPANGLGEIPTFTITAALTPNAGFTLKNANVYLEGAGSLTFANPGGQIIGSSIAETNLGNVTLDSTGTTITGSRLTGSSSASATSLVQVTPIASSTNVITNDIFYSEANQSMILYADAGDIITIADLIAGDQFLGNGAANTADELLVGANVSGLTISDNQFTDSSTTGQIAIANNAPTVAATDTLTIKNNIITLSSSTTGSTNTGIVINDGDDVDENISADILNNEINTANIVNNLVNTTMSGTGISFFVSLGTLTAKVQGNDLHFNQIGVAITPTDVDGSAADIDLGGGTQGSTGGNNFRGFTTTATATNGAIVITTPFSSAQTVSAENNIFSVSNPQTVIFGNGSTIVTTDNLTGNLAYVQTLYTNFLGRVGNLSNSNDAGFWVNLLNNGTSSTVVANGVLRSTEALDLQVNQLFQKLLNRNVDSSGQTFYVNLLQHGATLEQITGQILLSSEYQTMHGSNADFIQSLYNNLLNRNGSAGELSFWLNVINSSGRSAVVQGFLGSTEYRTDQIDQLYAQFLNRTSPPSQSEVNFWLNSNLDILSIETFFAASAEFQANG